jgi:uncharacterized membrane protein
MERMLVVVFDDENKAYEASRALHALDDEESIIAVYADALVTKQRDGVATTTTLHHAVPDGTMGATAIGVLLGILGGPVGMAGGAAGGFLIGATADFARSRVGRDFVTDVVNSLEPGKTALVAEIDEESTDRVDARMDALGGFVFRRALSDVANTAYEDEVAAIEADLAQTKAEHAATRTDRRGRLQARIDALNQRLHHTLDRAKARRAELRREAAAKVEHLKAQAASQRQDIRARQAARIEEVRRRYHEWLEEPQSHAN